MRRATAYCTYNSTTGIFLSTPSVRRATVAVPGFVYAIVISIHALREEGDEYCAMSALKKIVFLSTPSVRRATAAGNSVLLMDSISIHALREEGDVGDRDGHPDRRGISIHALREEGDEVCCLILCKDGDFYPRPP